MSRLAGLVSLVVQTGLEPTEAKDLVIKTGIFKLNEYYDVAARPSYQYSALLISMHCLPLWVLYPIPDSSVSNR